ADALARAVSPEHRARGVCPMCLVAFGCFAAGLNITRIARRDRRQRLPQKTANARRAAPNSCWSSRVVFRREAPKEVGLLFRLDETHRGERRDGFELVELNRRADAV